MLPESSDGHIRAQLQLYAGLTARINGHKGEAIQTLSACIHERRLQTGMVWERLRFGLAAIHLLGGKLPNDVQVVTQERAYTSPIWYTSNS